MNALNELFSTEASPPSSIVVPFAADEARSEIQKALRAKKWNAITLDYLKEHCSCPVSEVVASLTPDAFFYFLPAFLSMCLANEKQVDVLPEALLGRLERESDLLLATPQLLTMDQKKYVFGYFISYFNRSPLSKLARHLAEVHKQGASLN